MHIFYAHEWDWCAPALLQKVGEETEVAYCLQPYYSGAVAALQEIPFHLAIISMRLFDDETYRRKLGLRLARQSMARGLPTVVVVEEEGDASRVRALGAMCLNTGEMLNGVLSKIIEDTWTEHLESLQENGESSGAAQDNGGDNHSCY